MPILIVRGIPGDAHRASLAVLVGDLKRDVADLLGLKSDDVTVFMPPDLVQRGLGEELVCTVEGLFEKPERTPSVRKELAQVIVDGLVSFAAMQLPQCRKVEATVPRFNQEIDGFAMCDMSARR